MSENDQCDGEAPSMDSTSRLVIPVGAEQQRLNLHVIDEALGKQRTQRAIGHAGREDFFSRKDVPRA